jgi:hypothetical protein
MQHPYTTKLTYKAKKGTWPALRGELYEKDVLIGTFERKSVVDNIIPPITYKFRSDASLARFDDFSDSLSIEETIEALI